MSANFPLIVGFDFDGVVIYNPLHIARAPIAWFKRQFLGLNKTSFYKPQHRWQYLVWKILFLFSFPATDGLREIEKLKNEGKITPMLLTGRFDLSRKKVQQILTRAGFPHLFSEIITNSENEQPHIFKERVIAEKKMDIYVEDNIDIVIYLTTTTPCRIFWIYNFVDRRFDYQPKFPHLKDAVKALILYSPRGKN
jgi:hypothetical protein